MWLLVPLGNPGDEYTATRHNLGRLMLMRWMQDTAPPPGSCAAWAPAPSYGLKPPFQALVPGTYMNLSGQACAEAAAAGFDPGRMILLHDDKDLPLGQGRFRLSGSDGGHNGLKSVFARTEPPGPGPAAPGHRPLPAAPGGLRPGPVDRPGMGAHRRHGRPLRPVHGPAPGDRRSGHPGRDRETRRFWRPSVPRIVPAGRLRVPGFCADPPVRESLAAASSASPPAGAPRSHAVLPRLGWGFLRLAAWGRGDRSLDCPGSQDGCFEF